MLDRESLKNVADNIQEIEKDIAMLDKIKQLCETEVNNITLAKEIRKVIKDGH